MAAPSEVADCELFLEQEPGLQAGHILDSTGLADIVEPADVAEFSTHFDEPSDEAFEAEFHDTDAQGHEESDIVQQVTEVRQTQRYNLRSSTTDQHNYAVLSYKEAEVIYGPQAVREAGFTELRS